MWISLVVASIVSGVLVRLYLKTQQEIKRDDMADALARAQKFKNKRAAGDWADA